MEANDIGDVCKDLSKLEAWVEVKEGCNDVHPDWHVKVEEHLLDNGWLRKNNVHDH